MDQQMALPSRLISSYKKLQISESELVLLLQLIHFRSEGNDFPTPEELAERMTLTPEDCTKLLRNLIQKRLLTIEQKQSDSKVLNEGYSLEPLWECLYRKEREQEEDHQYDVNIFPLFEQEFGRPLSPFEIETVNIWLDHEQYEPALIKAALREAVLMGKLNFKYIDRILSEWNKKGIRTVEDARKESKQFRQGQLRRVSSENGRKRDVSLYYNWLEEDS